MATQWLRGLELFGAMVIAATGFASSALAEGPPAPGVEVDDETGRCTAGFAAQGNDGNYYLLTSGHCDAHDGSVWTYGQNIPLGTITASEEEGEKRTPRSSALTPALVHQLAMSVAGRSGMC